MILNNDKAKDLMLEWDAVRTSCKGMDKVSISWDLFAWVSYLLLQYERLHGLLEESSKERYEATEEVLALKTKLDAAEMRYIAAEAALDDAKDAS